MVAEWHELSVHDKLDLLKDKIERVLEEHESDKDKVEEVEKDVESPLVEG